MSRALSKRILPALLLTAALADPLFGQAIEFAPPSYPPNISNYFGVSVAGLVDVNGDGRGDIAIGDHGGQQTGNPYIGRVYIYSGVTHELLRAIAPPAPNPFGGDFGYQIVSVGDVNGDGRGDLAVSDIVASAPGSPSFAGVVYVYSGATGEMLYFLQSEHERSGLNFGYDFAAAPDIDGDGVTDIVVGSYHESGPDGAPNAGAIYLFSGRTGQRLRILLPPQTNCQSCSFGWAVAGVPDLDGDGLGDIASGAVDPQAPGEPLHPEVYIYSGATSALLHAMPISFRRLAGVPDLDGDRFGDVLVGNPATNPQGLIDHTGYVRVISGATAETIQILTSPTYPLDSGFGDCLVGLHDWTGDGRGDFLVGAIHESAGGLRPGAVYLFPGGSQSPIRQLSSLNPRNNGIFGSAIATVPDINADGRPEIIVGAPLEQFPGGSRGRAYLFLSCPADMNADGLATSQDFFDFLNAFFDSAPRADFNRDGLINSSDFFDYLTAFFAGCP